MRNYLVIDTANQPFHKNQLFNLDVACRYPGATAFVKLFAQATDRGFEVLTCDLVDSRRIRPRECILLTEQWSPSTMDLIRRGAMPGVVFSWETLWHAWSFYAKLRRISAVFRHVFVFEGARRRIDERRATFHSVRFPGRHCDVRDESGLAWRRKQFMLLVNSNKRPPVGLRYRAACLREPALRRDLYAERLRAIVHFAAQPEFHLYGGGWGAQRPWQSAEEFGSVSKCYKGTLPYEDKLAMMSRYRFVLCFENMDFKGYVTEKIFDCFFAGAIPVYLGAPDVDRYVPRDTYIDFREYGGDYRRLERYLLGMTAEQAAGYLSAARSFLTSAAYQPFYEDSVARSMLDAVEECRRAGEPARTLIFYANLASLAFGIESLTALAKRCGRRLVESTRV